MINSISFIHFYVAPFLILLSLIKFFYTPFKKDLLFSAFNLSVGILGVWEMMQNIVEGPYFLSIEAVLMGLSVGLLFSLGVRDNTLAQHPKKNRVLGKLPLLGAMGFLTLHNFLSPRSFRLAFIIVFLATLIFYFKKNIYNRYFQAMLIAISLTLLAQHFGMDELFKSLALLFGLTLLVFKFEALEKKNG